MDVLDESVLCDDAASVELRGVILDLAREAAALQLGQEADLTELREPH